jgi:four helix bundle protein
MALILIIDDDSTTIGLLRTRLEKAGHKVIEAKDGQEGLRLAEWQRPDLVLLDIRLPKLDGWQVCKSLKSNPLFIHCPVIMLTGCSQDAQELYGMQCGADEYITKPWDASLLMKTITKLLKLSGQARDVRSDASQQRVRQYVQRVVRVVGKLPKTAQLEPMAAQLLRIATMLVANFQTAVTQEKDFAAQIKSVYQQAEELNYWLSLLHESKAGDDPEIPILRAEGQVLLLNLKDALRDASQP